MYFVTATMEGDFYMWKPTQLETNSITFGLVPLGGYNYNIHVKYRRVLGMQLAAKGEGVILKRVVCSTFLHNVEKRKRQIFKLGMVSCC